MLIINRIRLKPSAPVSDTVTNNQNDKTDNQAKKMTLKNQQTATTKQDTKTPEAQVSDTTKSKM